MALSTLPFTPNITERVETFRELEEQLSSLSLGASERRGDRELTHGPEGQIQEEGRLFRDPTPRNEVLPRDEASDLRIPFWRASGILAKLTDFQCGAIHSLLSAGKLLLSSSQMHRSIPDSWRSIFCGLGHELPEASEILNNA